MFFVLLALHSFSAVHAVRHAKEQTSDNVFFFFSFGSAIYSKINTQVFTQKTGYLVQSRVTGAATNEPVARDGKARTMAIYKTLKAHSHCDESDRNSVAFLSRGVKNFS